MDKQTSELANLINQQKNASTPARKSSGPGLLAWVTAALIALFAMVMFIPAALNLSLTSYAALGMWHELRGDDLAAADIYMNLMNTEADIEAWAREHFAPGTGSGFTTNNFGIARRIQMLQRLYGPISFWQMEQQMHMHQMPPLLDWFADTRMPRRLARFAEQVEIVELILLGDMQRDDVPARHVLIYDSINLAGLAVQDPASDEVGELMHVLQSNRRHQWWMTSTVAQERARALEDWSLLANLAKQAVARNSFDFAAMQRHVRALFLAGNEDQAFAMSEYYAIAQPDIAAQMQLQRADFTLRQGNFAQTLEMTKHLRATHPLRHGQDNSVYMNAVALQGAALLLQGNIDEAYSLLRNYIEGQFPVNQQLVFTAFAAFIAADDVEFLDDLLEPLHPQLQELHAGNITLQEIFTQGWGVLS